VYSEDPITESVLDEMAAAFKAWWNTYLKTEVSSTVSLEVIRCRSLDSETGPTYDYTDGLPITATSAAASAPNNCTFAVQWRTASSGRSYRGRTYHIGLTTTKYSANMLTVPNATDFQTYYGNLPDALQTIGYNLVVLSRYHDRTQRPTAIHTLVTSCHVDRTLDSMRKRLPGRGS